MKNELFQGNIMDNERKKKILKERARNLAIVEEENSCNKENQINFLVFSLAQEKYAIDLAYISEVIYIKDITPLPCTPEFILGIINIRGKIISVIDIRRFFGLKDKGISNLNRVIILRDGDIEFGILTDEIYGNTLINIESLQTDIATITDVPDNFIIGIGKDNLIVLDINELLKNERIIINEEV